MLLVTASIIASAQEFQWERIETVIDSNSKAAQVKRFKPGHVIVKYELKTDERFWPELNEFSKMLPSECQERT